MITGSPITDFTDFAAAPAVDRLSVPAYHLSARHRAGIEAADLGGEPYSRGGGR